MTRASVTSEQYNGDLRTDLTEHVWRSSRQLLEHYVDE